MNIQIKKDIFRDEMREIFKHMLNTQGLLKNEKEIEQYIASDEKTETQFYKLIDDFYTNMYYDTQIDYILRVLDINGTSDFILFVIEDGMLDVIY